MTDTALYGSLGSGDSYAVYTDQFDPSLLNPMPRSHLRKRFNIDASIMFGYDVWHCHEATFLLDSGLPVAGTLKFVYPASSPFMVESKSVKLYLNSFDMCKMGRTLIEAKEIYVSQIKKDLETVIDDYVNVNFFDSVEWDAMKHENILDDAVNIATMESIYDEDFSDYKGEGNYITITEKEVSKGITGHYYTNVLRSRCRHTKQKDTGTAILKHHPWDIRLVVDPISFLRQVISLREVNEFHELCAEKLFMDVKNVISRRSLTRYNDEFYILLLYSRRGSIDINPVRSTNYRMIPDALIDTRILTAKTQGQ